MSRLAKNVVANYAGQAWIALMMVAFVPLYMKRLGLEQFALVGFMLTIQGMTQLLDFGVGGVINRQLAQGRDQGGLTSTPQDLVRTFECVVWPLAASIGLLVHAMGPWAATHWLHPRALSIDDVSTAISAMAVAIAATWPVSFYTNALLGLELQTRVNLINAIAATLRGAGVLLILNFVSPGVVAFMLWYAGIGMLQSIALAKSLWYALPPSARNPRFHFPILKSTASLAGGLFAITALGFALTQLDRIALSALRPLAELGIYGLAMSIAAGLARMVVPMFNALYPRFSQLVAANETAKLTHLYHFSSQCVAVVVSSVGAVLFFFSEDVLRLWTGNSPLASAASGPLGILIIGTCLNGLMNLPYALQLANGWTRLTAMSNLTALLVATPIGYWAIYRFGTTGAAYIWLGINLGFIAISLPLMHRRLLPGHLLNWYRCDILPSATASFGVAFLAKLVVGDLSRNLSGVVLLAFVSVTTLSAATVVAKPVRRLVVRLLLGWQH